MSKLILLVCVCLQVTLSLFLSEFWGFGVCYPLAKALSNQWRRQGLRIRYKKEATNQAVIPNLLPKEIIVPEGPFVISDGGFAANTFKDNVIDAKEKFTEEIKQTADEIQKNEETLQERAEELEKEGETAPVEKEIEPQEEKQLEVEKWTKGDEKWFQEIQQLLTGMRGDHNKEEETLLEEIENLINQKGRKWNGMLLLELIEKWFEIISEWQDEEDSDEDWSLSDSSSEEIDYPDYFLEQDKNAAGFGNYNDIAFGKFSKRFSSI